MKRHIALMSVLGLAYLSGCPTPPEEEEEVAPTTLRLATWFASGGELEALQTMVDAYTSEHKNASIQIQPVDIAPPPKRLDQYLGNNGLGVEWDLGFQTAPFMAAMAPVAVDLATIPELADRLADINAIGTGVVTPTGAGKYLGVPTNLIRLNNLIYNPKLLPTPPSTLQDYIDLCQAYVDGGKVGAKPLARDTSDARDNLITLLGLLPAEVAFGSDPDPRPKVLAALSVIEFYRDNGCFEQTQDVNGNKTSWDDVTQLLLNGKVKMIIGADWTKSLLIVNGQINGQDFRVANPTASAAYLYTVESLVLNVNAVNSAPAIQFLATALSPVAQIRYSVFRGGLPLLKSADPSTSDDAGLRGVYELFQTAAAANRADVIKGYISSSTKPGLALKPFMEGGMTTEMTPRAATKEVVAEIYLDDPCPTPGAACARYPGVWPVP